MAENLLGRLHTASRYLNDYNFNLDLSTGMYDADMALYKAQQIEERFYKQYNCNSFQEFRDKIKNHFLYNPKDAEIFQRFTYESLSSNTGLKTLSTFKGPSTLPPTTVIFRLDDSQVKGLGKTITKDLKQAGKGFTEVGDGFLELDLQLGLDDKLISKIAKKANGAKKARAQSDLTKTGFRELIEKEEKNQIVRVGDGPKELSVILTETMLTEHFPWGYTKKMINQIINDPSPQGQMAYTQLTKAYEQIKTFFTETLVKDGSWAIQKAAKDVWYQKLGNSPSSTFSFFEKGDVRDLQIGASGEYMLAMLTHYFNIVFNNNLSTTTDMVKILGDDMKKGVQGKVDVQLLQGIGAQVKNFALSWRKNKQIKVNTNAFDFSEAIENQQVQEDFRLFLANFYFNKDFANNQSQTLFNLKTEISKYIYAIYSMAVQDNLQSDSKVSFYFIGGNYLVPSSEILLAIKNNKQTNVGGEINFRPPSVTAYTDQEFHKKEKEGSKKSPLYTKYWTNSNGYWEATDKNKTQFESNLKGNLISTTMDYSYFISKVANQVSQYSLL